MRCVFGVSIPELAESILTITSTIYAWCKAMIIIPLTCANATVDVIDVLQNVHFLRLYSDHLWYASIVYCKHHHFHWLKFRPLSMSFAHYIYFHSPDKRTPLLMWWQTFSFPMTTVDVIGALQYTIISIIWGEHRKFSTTMWLFYPKALIRVKGTPGGLTTWYSPHVWRQSHSLYVETLSIHLNFTLWCPP